MGDLACLRLVLELEPGREPVRGWLQGPDGRRERFEGLLGLLVVLDAARVCAEHPEGRPEARGC